ASHTQRLAAAVPVFRASLAATPVRRPLPGTRLFSGIDGASVLDVDAGLDKLARQIAEPVEWAACLAACVEAGATAFLELGPGRALAEMAGGAYPALPARSLADFRSVDGVASWLARVAAG
ncbi:malonate decarboxylase subunit epsilon, partial [Burkholderia sp. Ac-20345]|nr:malonate decarboxylase subunit epsilon [Burkholderia sp. Ac-20345]